MRRRRRSLIARTDSALSERWEWSVGATWVQVPLWVCAQMVVSRDLRREPFTTAHLDDGGKFSKHAVRELSSLTVLKPEIGVSFSAIRYIRVPLFCSCFFFLSPLGFFRSTSDRSLSCDHELEYAS